MRASTAFALAFFSGLGGCATSGVLPEKAPPFSGDRPIQWPQRIPGTLAVTGYPKAAASTRPGHTAPWRLYDAQGNPVGEVRRESESLDLPAGSYVIMAKDTGGHIRTAQAVVRAATITALPLPEVSLGTSDALNREVLSE